jgi:hypothetical protein
MLPRVPTVPSLRSGTRGRPVSRHQMGQAPSPAGLHARTDRAACGRQALSRAMVPDISRCSGVREPFQGVSAAEPGRKGGGAVHLSTNPLVFGRVSVVMNATAAPIETYQKNQLLWPMSPSHWPGRSVTTLTGFARFLTWQVSACWPIVLDEGKACDSHHVLGIQRSVTLIRPAPL